MSTNKPPSDLDAFAKKIWQRHAAKYATNPVNCDWLSEYCKAASLISQCEKVIATDGILVETDRGGMKPNGAFLPLNQAFDRKLKAAKHLGMTTQQVEDESGDDPLSEFKGD